MLEHWLIELPYKRSFKILLREAWDCMPLIDKFEAALLYIPLWDINNGKTLCRKCHDKTKLGIKTDHGDIRVIKK